MSCVNLMLSMEGDTLSLIINYKKITLDITFVCVCVCVCRYIYYLILSFKNINIELSITFRCDITPIYEIYKDLNYQFKK